MNQKKYLLSTRKMILMIDLRIIISGGGTGGHIFPALSIAQEIKSRHKEVNILFVGAKGKMEMKKIPEAGFPIVGLWISGFQRGSVLKNLLLPLKLIVSFFGALILLLKFKPNVVVGVGGFASAPLLYVATKLGIPTLIQEQNSYAGLTNKWLASKVDVVCVAYDGLEKYFPKDKIVIVGNPVRSEILNNHISKKDSLDYFKLEENKKTLLIMGGSLGARTINHCVVKDIERVLQNDIQVLWQVGSGYYEDIREMSREHLHILKFIDRMDLAYVAADLVISRAGALTISELMVTGKPCILVPSPNVVEDHQSINVRRLVRANAAETIKDSDASDLLLDRAVELLSDEKRCNELSSNIKKLAKPFAKKQITDEVLKLVK